MTHSHSGGAQTIHRARRAGITGSARRSEQLHSPTRVPGPKEARSAPGSYAQKRDLEAAEVLRWSLDQDQAGSWSLARLHDQLEALGVRHRADRQAIIEELRLGGYLQKTGGRGWQARYLRVS